MEATLGRVRVPIAIATATFLAISLFLMFAGPALADSPSTYPWSAPTNEPSFWENYGETTHGEDDWTCTKDDTSDEDPYVLGSPPVGEVWRLLVVKAGSDFNDLFWDPAVGGEYEHSEQGGWSHVILCSQPDPGDTTTTTEGTTTTTEGTTTTSEGSTTTDTVLGTTITTTSTTVGDTVLGTTLPFTGAESQSLALLAMALSAAGGLVLLATRRVTE